MDFPWFADTNDYGAPRLWPGHAIRLRRDFWEHACLDVDVDRGTVTHRDQLDHAIGDPEHWPSFVRPLRRHDRWEVLVEQADLQRWIVNHERALAATRELALRAPYLESAADVAERAHKLELIRALGFGWVPLAKDVSLAIDQALGQAAGGFAIVDAWSEPEARRFFRNVWPMYVHELSGFDTDFYALDETGRWLPDLVEGWIASTNAVQRTHVITRAGRPVGFVCVGVKPFKHMPADVDQNIAELFLIREARGTKAAIRALELLLHRYSGRWHLQVIHDNARALGFWRKALPLLGVSDLEEAREEGDVAFRFATG